MILFYAYVVWENKLDDWRYDLLSGFYECEWRHDDMVVGLSLWDG